jgi:hypothetical protein
VAPRTENTPGLLGALDQAGVSPVRFHADRVEIAGVPFAVKELKAVRESDARLLAHVHRENGEAATIIVATGSQQRRGELYRGIDDFIDGTHKQISRCRRFYRSGDGSFREFTAPFRYVWPAALDLAARITGTALEHRWAWWDRSTVHW